MRPATPRSRLTARSRSQTIRRSPRRRKNRRRQMNHPRPKNPKLQRTSIVQDPKRSQAMATHPQPPARTTSYPKTTPPRRARATMAQTHRLGPRCTCAGAPPPTRRLPGPLVTPTRRSGSSPRPAARRSAALRCRCSRRPAMRARARSPCSRAHRLRRQLPRAPACQYPVEPAHVRLQRQRRQCGADVTAALTLTVPASLALRVTPHTSHAGGTIVFAGTLHGTHAAARRQDARARGPRWGAGSHSRGASSRCSPRAPAGATAPATASAYPARSSTSSAPSRPPRRTSPTRPACRTW